MSKQHYWIVTRIVKEVYQVEAPTKDAARIKAYLNGNPSNVTVERETVVKVKPQEKGGNKE